MLKNMFLFYRLIVVTFFSFRKLESTQLNCLRASSNGLLDIFGLLSEVVQKFDVNPPSANYDHF